MSSTTLSVRTSTPGALKQALNYSGWLGDEVVAAGQLRQGQTSSMLAMITGAAVIELLKPRGSKRLPRHFVLVVTPDRVAAFKATGGGAVGHDYQVHIQPGEVASWPRGEISLVDLPDGPASKGATMVIADERISVTRPNLPGDPNTDELLALLSAG
jgi:hypothetical protein